MENRPRRRISDRRDERDGLDLPGHLPDSADPDEPRPIQPNVTVEVSGGKRGIMVAISLTAIIAGIKKIVEAFKKHG